MVETDPRLRDGSVTLRDIILGNNATRIHTVAGAIRLLEATVQCWNAKEMIYEAKPDHQTRLKAITFLAAYSDGLPVATNLNLNATPGGNRKEERADDLELLARSPAALKAAERMVEAAKRRAKALAAGSAPVVEVTSKSAAT
jgi:hypothetical protein